MVKNTRKRFGDFSEGKEDFFVFDSEETRQIKRKRFFGKIKGFFVSYPWWFYYISYILIFTLSVTALLLYALYAPASVSLSVSERSFVRISVLNYIYQDALQNLTPNSLKNYWEDRVPYETDALDPNFITLSETGPLPYPFNGINVWERFRSTYNQPLTNKKKIVLIFSNLGNFSEATEIIIDSKAEITLELNPYSPIIGQWMLFARAQGHEVLLTVPIADASHKINYNPGPLGVNFSVNTQKNIIALEKAMSITTGYAGLSFYHIPPFESYDSEKIAAVFKKINEHSLYVLAQRNYRDILRDIPGLSYGVIDNQLFDYDATYNYLDELNDIIDTFADSNRQILVLRVAIYPFSVVKLKEWGEQLNTFQIIPLSYLFSQPQ